jgi:hypothetical protein
MAGYHGVLVHFPIALLMTATLAILVRAVSDGPLAQAVDRALVPLMAIGLLAGVVAYVVGLLVWPWQAISSTPLGRNHMLLATWTLAYWALLLATRWIQGEAVWYGPMRWIMAARCSVLQALSAVIWSASIRRCRRPFGSLVGRSTRPTTCRTSRWQ